MGGMMGGMGGMAIQPVLVTRGGQPMGVVAVPVGMGPRPMGPVPFPGGDDILLEALRGQLRDNSPSRGNPPCAVFRWNIFTISGTGLLSLIDFVKLGVADEPNFSSLPGVDESTALTVLSAVQECHSYPINKKLPSPGHALSKRDITELGMGSTDPNFRSSDKTL